MIQVTLETNPDKPLGFCIVIEGRAYGEERIEISYDAETKRLTQTNTIVDKCVSCIRNYRKSESSTTDNFDINYRSKFQFLIKKII